MAKKVLIVEEPGLCKLFKELIKNKYPRADVTITSQPTADLPGQIAEISPQLCLLGYYTCKKILDPLVAAVKALPTANRRIILMSGGHAEAKEQAERLGLIFLQKPFSPTFELSPLL